MNGPPAYVLGGSKPGLAVVRALGRRGVSIVVVTASPDEHAGASRFASASVRGPNPADDPDGFVDLLFRIADDVGEGVLFPTTDESLEAVTVRAAALSGRFRLACPPPEIARRVLDKQLTHGLALELGVSAPRTVTPRSEAELEDAAAEFGYPCLIKPRESFRYMRAFGVKMKEVRDRRELRQAWHAASAAGVETMVQELIPGPETAGVNYNAYVVDGQPWVELTAAKVRLSPPDFGYPTAVLSRPVPEVLGPARDLLRGLGLRGFANVEFKRDERDGRYKLLEVNARPNLSGSLSVRCGVDFPFIAYSHLVTGDPPEPPRAVQGIYWINEFSDPLALLRRWRRGCARLPAELVPYFSRHVFATFARYDIAPFLAAAPGRGRSLAHRVLEAVADASALPPSGGASVTRSSSRSKGSRRRPTSPRSRASV
ncbi:MAG TPA: ATP-grasp domain-containing protein [Thermoleophilaceae bacterium]|nr:ATP-grasp domain-containing protein [Thermoleophilaceae bacterium]